VRELSRGSRNNALSNRNHETTRVNFCTRGDVDVEDEPRVDMSLEAAIRLTNSFLLAASSLVFPFHFLGIKFSVQVLTLLPDSQEMCIRNPARHSRSKQKIIREIYYENAELVYTKKMKSKLYKKLMAQDQWIIILISFSCISSLLKTGSQVNGRKSYH
jgi:hypothetical protein